ncbi:MAG: DUF2459 domain-containing protein [Cyanobacteria bacterium P01_A01_bin.17]
MKEAVPLVQWSGRALALLALLLGLPPVYMAVFTPYPVSSPWLQDRSLPPGNVYDLYVANWGYHTSIILQQPQGWRLGPSNAVDTPFVEYSWGDRNFYMNADFSPPALFATVFLPTRSVLHLRNWSQAPTSDDGMRHLYHRQINAQQLSTLIGSLETTFKGAEPERPDALPPVARFRGRFYPAREFYIFWSACNAWTVNHLAAADLARPGWSVLAAEQVAPKLRHFQALSRSH